MSTLIQIFLETICYKILIVITAGFSLIIATIFASSNKSVLGYFGIVCARLSIGDLVALLSITNLFMLIFRSFIFKTIICLIFFILSCFFSVNIASTIITLTVLSLILYSGIKAKNKLFFLVKLALCLSILYCFWSSVSYLDDKRFFYIFFTSYTLFNFDDVDYLDIMKSYGLHNMSIGDPGGLAGGSPGPGGGGQGLSAYLMANSEDPEDWTLPLEFYGLKPEKASGVYDLEETLHNSPGVQNFKSFIEYNDKVYTTSKVQELIKINNKNLICASAEEVEDFKTLYFAKTSKYHSLPYVSKSIVETIPSFVCSLESSLRYYTFECNTLIKGKMWFENIVPSDDLITDYNNAFQIWQKRQIKFGAMDLILEKFEQGKTVNKHVTDYTLNINAYHELKENLLWASLYLIQCSEVLDYISKNITSILEDSTGFDTAISRIVFSNYESEKYREAYKFLHDYNTEKELITMVSSHEDLKYWYSCFNKPGTQLTPVEFHLKKVPPMKVDVKSFNVGLNSASGFAFKNIDPLAFFGKVSPIFDHITSEKPLNVGLNTASDFAFKKFDMSVIRNIYR